MNLVCLAESGLALIINVEVRRINCSAFKVLYSLCSSGADTVINFGTVMALLWVFVYTWPTNTHVSVSAARTLTKRPQPATHKHRGHLVNALQLFVCVSAVYTKSMNVCVCIWSWNTFIMLRVLFLIYFIFIFILMHQHIFIFCLMLFGSHSLFLKKLAVIWSVGLKNKTVLQTPTENLK